MERSIIETHKKMLLVIPEDQIELINSLNKFIYSVRNYSEVSLKVVYYIQDIYISC